MDTTSSKRLANAWKGNRPSTGDCVVTQSGAGGVNALEVPSRDTSVEETRNHRGENKNTRVNQKYTSRNIHQPRESLQKMKPKYVEFLLKTFNFVIIHLFTLGVDYYSCPPT
jgi:hypothetical protein